MQFSLAFLAAVLSASSVTAIPADPPFSTGPPASSVTGSSVSSGTRSSAPSGTGPPAPAGTVNMMAEAGQWTIAGMRRTCTLDDSVCIWNFNIVTDRGLGTPCIYIVRGTRASQRAGGPVECGNFNSTSGWSGQFGPGNGFTTFSVISSQRQIIWPAYTDNQVMNGNLVRPDQSYLPANLPR
ncbi:hypothetical protein FGRMN_2799 [Fusarium graminum]|nr:hypothetical protein FGRMN_2799 [Fusarium graminum]